MRDRSVTTEIRQGSDRGAIHSRVADSELPLRLRKDHSESLAGGGLVGTTLEADSFELERPLGKAVSAEAAHVPWRKNPFRGLRINWRQDVIFRRLIFVMESLNFFGTF
jgi:hypothetical protein